MKRSLVIFALCLSLILTLAIPVFAVDAVPSIEQKGTPEVVSTSDPSIVVTPLYAADSESNVREAYEDLKDLDLGDDVVIRDIFDVTGDVKSGSITLDVSNYDGDIIVLEYVNGKWQQVPAERITINPDGTITIYLNELCPLALAQGTISNGLGEGHGCPFILCRIFKTDIACNHTHCLEFNGKCMCWTWWLLLLIIIVLILLFIIRRIYKKVKKQEDKQEKKAKEARARREERKKNK